LKTDWAFLFLRFCKQRLQKRKNEKDEQRSEGFDSSANTHHGISAANPPEINRF
jgi:hypothetical protein